MADKEPADDPEYWRPPGKMEPDKTSRFRVPIDQLATRITPNSDIFVLSHFGVPRIDAAEWRLHFSGFFARPKTMTLDDIRAFPKQEIESFIKCAGFPADHRIATRNASNAVWAGARLSDIMEVVGLSRTTSYLWFYAPDFGSYAQWSANRYIKDMPIERLSAGDVLLAYEVNGEPLSPEHGFPVRIFIPGYYGTNSVKWLCRIDAARTRAPGIFTNELYNDPVIEGGNPTNARVPVWGVAPEALIVAPAAGDKVSAGLLTIRGWCWGERPIAKVDLSHDGGQTWLTTTPEARNDHSWQGFSFRARLESPGRVSLTVRATDVACEAQPDRDARNSVHTIEVTVVE
jgi:sulfane dehydrogenase subunit SoxC